MNDFNRSTRLFLSLLCLFTVVSCSALFAEPTPTMVPPTETPIPATPTPSPIPSTPTPTPPPVVTVTGRLVYADSMEPLSEVNVMGMDENGAIKFSGTGILMNPTTDTDEDGYFTLIVSEEFLESNNNEFMVMVLLFSGKDLTNRYYPLLSEEGYPIVLQVQGAPADIDLGEIPVEKQ